MHQYGLTLVTPWTKRSFCFLLRMVRTPSTEEQPSLLRTSTYETTTTPSPIGGASLTLWRASRCVPEMRSNETPLLYTPLLARKSMVTSSKLSVNSEPSLLLFTQVSLFVNLKIWKQSSISILLFIPSSVCRVARNEIRLFEQVSRPSYKTCSPTAIKPQKRSSSCCSIRTSSTSKNRRCVSNQPSPDTQPT